MKVKVNGGESNCLALVKRMMFLAWKACGGTFGLGWLQDKGPNQTEDQVWEAMYNRKDYPGGNALSPNNPGKVYADYVMGRMMKVGFKWTTDSVELNDSTPRRDYQAWCKVYPTYLDLLKAAATDLGMTKDQLPEVL